MESKPNVAGACPAWLFDIDSLTQTMNYHPVPAENQSNSNVGFQDTEKAGVEGTQTYVLFPILFDGSTNPKNNNKDAHADGKEHDDDIQKSVSFDIHSSSCGDQTRKQGDKTENKDKGKSFVVTITGFRNLNEEFAECINNSSNEVNAAGSLISAAGLNFSNNTNDFKEPKRVHQALKHPSWIQAMQEELLQFKMQKVWILVNLPYGKRAIVYQMDVKSTFLYGTIEEEVYDCQPSGFEDPKNPDKVYKVVKALYGLH
nr:retrotransposon protein, putative, unclassified [Tanacetum cinerariifolium]